MTQDEERIQRMSEAHLYVVRMFEEFFANRGNEINWSESDPSPAQEVITQATTYYAITLVHALARVFMMESSLGIDEEHVHKMLLTDDEMTQKIIAASIQGGVILGISVAYALETGFINELMNKLKIE